MSSETLSFHGDDSLLEVSETTEGSEYALEICIIDEREDSAVHSYHMNENELFALFNLLYKILKRDHSNRLEELSESVAHSNLTDT